MTDLDRKRKAYAFVKDTTQDLASLSASDLSEVIDRHTDQELYYCFEQKSPVVVSKGTPAYSIGLDCLFLGSVPAGSSLKQVKERISAASKELEALYGFLAEEPEKDFELKRDLLLAHRLTISHLALSDEMVDRRDAYLLFGPGKYSESSVVKTFGKERDVFVDKLFPLIVKMVEDEPGYEVNSLLEFVYDTNLTKLFGLDRAFELLKRCVEGGISSTERFSIQSKILEELYGEPDLLRRLTEVSSTRPVEFFVKNRNQLLIWSREEVVDLLIQRLSLPGFTKG